MSWIMKWNTVVGKYCLRETKTSSTMKTYNWIFAFKLNMYSSDNAFNLPTNDEKIPRKLKPQNQLSPTSRILDMLSNEKSSKTNLNNSSAKEETVLSDNTENEVIPIPGTKNPTNYNSSNPRSAKNMSYVTFPSHGETNNSSFMVSEKKSSNRNPIRSLSVADRIASLKNDTESNEQK